MIVCIDVGNTDTVLGVFCGEELKVDVRSSTDKNRKSAEYYSIFHPLFEKGGVRTRDIKGVVLSSVVPSTTPHLKDFSREYLNINPIIVNNTIDAGLKLNVPDPSKVGADIIANTAAAKKDYGHPLIVVDFGTATTFDVVDEKGDYIGTSICTGVNMMLQALVNSASLLSEVDLKKPKSAIGNNTTDAITAGLYFGYLSMVDGILSKITKEYFSNKKVKVISTGGLGQIFTEESEYVGKYDKTLTLKGLKYIFELNTC